MTGVEAIARQEGWGIAGAIPTRDNNPGDIEAGAFATAEGATGVDARNPRFATFATAEEGLQALRDLLTNAKHEDGSFLYFGRSIHDALNTYAPPVENDTSAYEANVCLWTNAQPSDLVTAEWIG